MLKNWFLLASASCGIGFGFSLVVSRNLQHSAWAGAGTVPAVIVSVNLLARQRREEIERQTDTMQQSLSLLQKQQYQITQKLQSEETTYQNLSSESQRLQSLVASLDQKAHRYDQAQRAIQQEMVTLAQKREVSQQALQALHEKLSVYSSNELEWQQRIAQYKNQIQECDQQLLRINEKINYGQQQEIAAESKLQEIKDATQQLLHSQAAIEQSRQATVKAFAELESKHHNLAQQVHEKTQRCKEAAVEIQLLTARQDEIQEQTQYLTAAIIEKQNLLSNLEASLTEKQVLIDGLETSLAEKQLLLNGLETSLIERETIADNIFDLRIKQQKHQGILQELQVEVKSQQALMGSIKEQVTEKSRELEFLRHQITSLQNFSEPEAIQTHMVSFEPSVEPWAIIPDIETEPSTIIEPEKSLPEDTSGEDKKFWNSMGLDRRKCLYHPQELIPGNKENFTNPRYTERIWNEQILPFWQDRDKELGHRFLGNVTLTKDDSDQIIELVGENLRQVPRFSAQRVRRCFDVSQNWLKILTFAVSEYAYYYSDEEQFWDGLCKRWRLKSSQSTHLDLRELVEQGIEILGLVKAVEGYVYVSTLWLQNGVSKRNLGHFATIIRDVSSELSWSELANMEAQGISHYLYQRCEERYPQWRTVLQLLRYSCFDSFVRPIAGDIVQGVGRTLYPEIFDYETKGDANFQRVQQELIKFIDSPLSLTKSKPRYSDPESTRISLDVDEFYILDDGKNVIDEWIWGAATEHFSCLIFDSISGDYLPIDTEDRRIIHFGNIFCFVPATIKVEARENVQLHDIDIPCSLKNWHGYKLNLQGELGQFFLCQESSAVSYEISWCSHAAQGQIIGLQSPKSLQYLDKPTLWLLPTKEKTQVRLEIHALEQGEKYEDMIVVNPNGDKWQEVLLHQWLKDTGGYRLYAKGDMIDYQTKFIWNSEASMNLSPAQISDQSPSIYLDGYLLGDQSRPYEDKDSFLAVITVMEKLWPLETVYFVLRTNGIEIMRCPAQADKLGKLNLKMTEFYSAITPEQNHTVSYCRDGETEREFIKLSSPPSCNISNSHT